jgi:TRAP-type C4-dicarboxylate transport system permease small subunit
MSIQGFKKLLLELESLLLILLFVFMIIIVLLEVILRTLGFPLFWSEELARYSFVWLIIIGAIIGVERENHFNVDFFIKFLPDILQKVAYFTRIILTLLFLITLLSKGIYLCLSMSGVTSPGAGMSQYFLYIIIPIGALIMIIHLIIQLKEKIRG